MLKMNLITQKELYGEVYREVYEKTWRGLHWGVDRETWRELYWEVSIVRGELKIQILTDFSHSKISRV
jgi:hypothetical protein